MARTDPGHTVHDHIKDSRPVLIVIKITSQFRQLRRFWRRRRQSRRDRPTRLRPSVFSGPDMALSDFCQSAKPGVCLRASATSVIKAL